MLRTDCNPCLPHLRPEAALPPSFLAKGYVTMLI